MLQQVPHPQSRAAPKAILIANRGEIAVRIAQTLRDMGHTPIGVYAQQERFAPHLAVCSRSYSLGEGSVAQTYLNGAKIIEMAKDAGATAIHPGYGFLAENAQFAQQVEAAGLIFIGPSPDAIAVMGDKLKARQRMQQAGVPCVPGSLTLAAQPQDLATLADQLGYPLLCKAVAGGGGHGVRVARSATQLQEAYNAAALEAQRAFGNGQVYLERKLNAPRHIEVQVIADHHGNIATLGLRECSLQRRYQKVLEEAPAPQLSAALQGQLETYAQAAAQAVAYRGVGTVEFLLSASGEVYFLEMNTRLQVEHTVTEMCYQVDLVEAQIHIALGAPLSSLQLPATPRGWAWQARLYAEDPSASFAPSCGRIVQLRWPTGPGIRIDSGIREGSHVGLDYDPLLAKLIVWGSSRAMALARLQRALQETVILGVSHNARLLQQLAAHPDVVAGDYHTETLQAALDAPKDIVAPSCTPPPTHVATLALAVAAHQRQAQQLYGRAAFWREIRSRQSWRSSPVSEP